jgi:hypothetical protein
MSFKSNLKEGIGRKLLLFEGRLFTPKGERVERIGTG